MGKGGGVKEPGEWYVCVCVCVCVEIDKIVNTRTITLGMENTYMMHVCLCVHGCGRVCVST